MRTLTTIFVQTMIVTLGLRQIQAADPSDPTAKGWFEANYTKHEYRVPMRDGVKLFTLIYTPKDTSTNYPILLQRTPFALKPYTIDEAKKLSYTDAHN